MTTDTTTRKPKRIRQRDLISSLERGFRVLRVFDQSSVEMTPSEVARKTGVPRAATRRVLLTLCELGYAVSDGKYFRLTPKVLDLAHGYLAKTRIRDLIDPVMRETVEGLKESCTLAIRDGADTISIASCNANSFGAVSVNVGHRIPLYVSTAGRLILASLPKQELSSYLAEVTLKRMTPQTITSKTALRDEINRVREQGHAVGREEMELGVYALAVPVRTGAGQTIAGLTCIGNVARLQTQEALDQRLKVLYRAAAHLGALLPDAPDFTQDLQNTARG